MTRPDTGIAKVEDLKGRTVAVTRGTDPYIFLLRSLASVGLTEKDINVVLLQAARSFGVSRSSSSGKAVDSDEASDIFSSGISSAGVWIGSGSQAPT